MAVRTVRVCDVCGAVDADAFDVTINGSAFAADLCDEHAEVLRAIQRSAGERVDPPVEKPQPPLRRDTPRAGAVEPRVVRAWAVEQGIDVPAKGRIPGDVLAKYLAVH